MNTITINKNDLIIEPRGLDKLWGFRRKLIIPLIHVRGATVDSGVADEPKGIRAPGLHVFGKVVGTFHRDGETIFWNISNARNNVVIEFEGEDYARAIVTVAEPLGVEKMINEALQKIR